MYSFPVRELQLLTSVTEIFHSLFLVLLVWLCYQLHGSLLLRVDLSPFYIFPPSPKTPVFPFMLWFKVSVTFWLSSIAKTKLHLNVKQKSKRAQSCPLSPDSRLWPGCFYLSWSNLSQEIAFPFSVINSEKTYHAFLSHCLVISLKSCLD